VAQNSLLSALAMAMTIISTHSTVPQRVEAVDLAGWLHTQMVYPSEDGHPSKYYPGPMLINFVDQTNVANHYTRPPVRLTDRSQHITTKQNNMSVNIKQQFF